jgi:hypothetical protein
VTAQRARSNKGKRSPEPAIVLRGGPRGLAASLPSIGARSGASPLSTSEVSVVVDGAVPERVRIRTRREPDAPSELRVRLAASTPPGRYEGVATVGDRAVPIVFNVEPTPRLRALPSRVETVAGPSASETVEIHLANSGNQAVDIPERSSFCLFDSAGIDHAVWAALTADPPKGKGRTDILLDDLAASHGGLVDVRVRDGAGSLAPGEERTCRLELRWSDRLRPGRSYGGAWEVAGLRLPIRVETPRAKTSRAQPAATRPAAAKPAATRPAAAKPSPAKPSPAKPAPAKPPTTARRAR